jgi:hypothetical protein
LLLPIQSLKNECSVQLLLTMPIYMLLEVGNINLRGKIESWTLLLILFLPFFLVNNNGGSILFWQKKKKNFLDWWGENVTSFPQKSQSMRTLLSENPMNDSRNNLEPSGRIWFCLCWARLICSLRGKLNCIIGENLDGDACSGVYQN